MSDKFEIAKDFFIKGSDLLLQGDLALAEEALLESLKLLPDRLSTQNNLSTLYLEKANRLADKEEYDGAVKNYELSIKYNPKNYISWNNLGVIYADHLSNLNLAIDCFKESLKISNKYADAHFNLGNAFVQTRNFKAALEHFDTALEINNLKFEAHTNKGLIFLQNNLNEQAISCFEKSIGIEILNPNAWTNKGIALQKLRRFQEALLCHNKALEIDPNLSEAWSNKGAALFELGKISEAKICYKNSIHHKKLNTEAIYNYGILLHSENEHENAIELYQQVLEINPRHSKALWNISQLQLLKGDYVNGWQNYEKRWDAIEGSNYRHTNIRELQDIFNINEKSILVWHEQGLGDTIHFSRYIKKLKNCGAKITFEVQNPLVEILEKNLDVAITNRINNSDKFDFQIPLLSLPKIFNTSIETIPNSEGFLRAAPNKIEHWSKKLQLDKDELNIGVAVSGNINNLNDKNRSMKLDEISPLLTHGNFFLIQKEINAIDKIFLEKYPEINFLGNEIEDFSDTAAIISNLDLVISVDTSIIHLAGALGKKAFLMLPWAPEWRWLLDRKDSPWYKSITLFRQPSKNDWQSVIQEISDALDSNKTIKYL